MQNNYIFFHFFFVSVVSFLSAGCINLAWSVSKTVHCRVLDLPGDKKNVGENRGEMGISLETQDAAHKGFCGTFPLYRSSRSLEQFQTQGFLRIESTAVQRCARKSTEFSSQKSLARTGERWKIP